MISGINGNSVRIIIFVGCVAVLISCRDTAAAMQGSDSQWNDMAESNGEIGDYPADWLPLDPPIMSEISADSMDAIVSPTDPTKELDSFLQATDMPAESAWLGYLEAQAAAALTVPAVEVSCAGISMPPQTESDAIDDARLTQQFAIIYGALCLLVIVSGVGSELASSRSSRRQALHEGKLERQLAALSVDTPRQYEESAILSDLQRQLADHEQDMERFKTSEAAQPSVAVPAAPE